MLDSIELLEPGYYYGFYLESEKIKTAEIKVSENKNKSYLYLKNETTKRYDAPILPSFFISIVPKRLFFEFIKNDTIYTILQEI